MRNRFMILLVMIFLLATAGVEVRAQGGGVLEGQVLNATSGGIPEAGILVDLWTLDAEEHNVLMQEVTDAEGAVRFENLDMENFSYQLQVEYKGVSYWSNVVVFSQGDALLSVPITVYDSTSSSEDLWIERAHLILEFEPGAIVVQEMHIFVNGGDKVYASSLEGSRRTAHFPLPSGATDLEMTEALMTCCIEMVEGGFAYTRPIVPGEMEFFFSYRLPYQTTSYTLSKNVVYPIHSADVLIADEGVKVTSSNLTAREPVTPQGRRYLHFSAQGLAQGDDLTLQLTDLPLTIQPREVQSPVSTVQGRAFMALGALAVLLVLSYPFWRHPRGEKN